jgi:hypothetical protein
MNDETLLARLAPVTDEQAAAMVSRQALTELAEEIIRTAPGRPPAARDRGPARHGGRVRRSGRLPLVLGAAALAAAVAVVVAVAVALVVPAGTPAPAGRTGQNETSGPGPRPAPGGPSGSAALDAWTVTENRDGTVKVTIREMDDPAGLQARLRADGVRVVVTASLGWPAACGEWRGGHFTMGGRVLENLNRTGLPTADGTEFIIRPSLIPAAALLWLGISQTGKPSGVAGPPGPMSAGYLTATRACTRS